MSVLPLRYRPLDLDKIRDPGIRATIQSLDESLRSVNAVLGSIVAPEQTRGEVRIQAPIVPRILSADPTSVAAFGQVNEIALVPATSSLYVKTITSAQDTNWTFAGTGSGAGGAGADIFGPPYSPALVDLDTPLAGFSGFSARADHKHKLDESIAPTWSSAHVFTPSTDAVPITVSIPAGRASDAIGVSIDDVLTTRIDGEGKLGINIDPDAWVAIQNSGGDDGSADVLALAPWGWWSADYLSSDGSGAYADGAQIGTDSIVWYDRSLNSRHWNLAATNDIDLRYVITTLGTPEFTSGKPALAFDGDARGTFASQQFLTINGSGTGVTIFAVYRQRTAAAQGLFLLRAAAGGASPDEFIAYPRDPTQDQTGDGWRVQYGTNEPAGAAYIPGNPALPVGGGGNTLVNPSWVTDDYNVHVLTGEGQFANHIMYLNGVEIGNRAVSEIGAVPLQGTLLIDNLRTISGQSGTSGSELWLAEVVIFSSVLSAANRQLVETYLNNKYGLNGGAPTSAGFDYVHAYAANGDLVALVDSAGRTAVSDVDISTATLTSRLTLRDAAGAVARYERATGTPTYGSNWSLTQPTAERTITIPDATGTLLLSSNIGTTVQAWDVDLDEIAAVANVRGDMLYTNSGPNWVRLPVGAASTLLRSDGTDPSWGTVDLLSAYHGDVAAGTVARGDIIIGQSETPKWTRLPLGTVGKYLYSDGTDAIWRTPTAGDVGAEVPLTFSNGLLRSTNDVATTGKLRAIHDLANAAGWLRNDGAGVFSYTTPTAADVGPVPTSRTLTAGAGLTGTGDLSADRTFAVGAGTGIAVNADDVALAAGNVLDLFNLADANGYLRNNAGTLTWDSPSGAVTDLNSLTDVTITTQATGDLVYASASNAWVNLPGNATTTRNFLRSLGSGGLATAPVWDTVTKTDVGLSAVENTALSTWAGSTSIVTLGTIATGTFPWANLSGVPSLVTSVGATTPIASSGGTTPTISHATSGVTAASYTNANITVDATGHVTAAANGTGGGATTFLALTDAPDDYTGFDGWPVVVDETGNAVGFNLTFYATTISWASDGVSSGMAFRRTNAGASATAFDFQYSGSVTCKPIVITRSSDSKIILNILGSSSGDRLQSINSAGTLTNVTSESRSVLTDGTTLSGGGDLSTDRTLSLVVGILATPGTYRSVTADTYGRVTSGSNPTTLAGYGITDAQPLAANLTGIAGVGISESVPGYFYTDGDGNFDYQIPTASEVGAARSDQTAVRAVKTSDQTSIGTTYTDVSGLGVSVAANKSYVFKFWVLVRADATTTGIDITLNGPSSPTSINYSIYMHPVSGTVPAFYHQAAYAVDTARTGSHGTTYRPYVIEGVLVNGSNAGTLNVQVKREAVGSGPDVQAGSWSLAWLMN